MFPRSFVLIATLALVLIILAWSPLIAPRVGDPIVLSPEALSPTPIRPIASPTPSAGVNSVLEPLAPSFTLTQQSNCYNGPGIGYSVVRAVESGERVLVVGRTQDNSWWRASLKDSVICWIASEAGTFSGEAGRIPITSSQYATKPVTPTRERPTAEPTQTKDSNFPIPTDPVVQLTSTIAPVINTPIPPTQTPGALAKPTTAPATSTAAPQINQPQPLAPGQPQRSPTNTPKPDLNTAPAPTNPPATDALTPTS